MADFNKRIFGSEIDSRIKNKLIARQALADNPNPNESIQFMEINGEQVDISEAIQTHNFSGEDNKAPFLFELSSRTPWARAWVAVELYYYSPEKLSRAKTIFKKGTYTKSGIVKFKTKYDKGDRYATEQEVLEAEVNYMMEKKVYVLGDNNYNLFSGQQNIHDPIEGRTSGETGVTNSIRDMLKVLQERG